jgi:hypothetical protein
MGYEVEFPKTSNQKGFDLLVNDHPVQVKCLNDPDGVREHLERFPDIPVVVNNELSPYFENVDGVYTVPSFSHDDVVNSTKATLDAGSDLLDLEVPLVAAATAAGKNVWGIVRGRTDFVAALENVALDVVGGAAGGTAGAKILGMAGLVLGPYGGVVGGLIGAVLGANQGRRAASWFKGKFLCRDAEAIAGQALARFMSAAAREGWQKASLLDKKIEILEKNLTSRGPGSRVVWNSHFRQRAEYERRYVTNKVRELEQAAAQPLRLDADGEDVFRACAEGAMLVIQAGIPPYALALEYRNLADNVARLQHERQRYFLQ